MPADQSLDTTAAHASPQQWIAIFEDHRDRMHLRAQLFEAHVDYLSATRGSIRLAGAVRSDTDAPWIGGVWIISAGRREDAVDLCESDPFFVHGLRRSYQLFQWGRAPCYGETGTILV